MPEPLHPPFLAGALTQPRQLNRWLDTNAQGGALSKIATYLTVQAFSVPFTWLGVSDIVASFNVESPNNFSLKAFTPPVNPNYVMCISYRVGGVVTRYMLWDAVGSKMNRVIPMYTGQPILKNCRFEVWSTSSGSPVVNADVLTFYTSVLGSIDYRYGSDVVLVANDGTQTAFAANDTPYIGHAPTTNLFAAWRPDSGIATGHWLAYRNTTNLNQLGSGSITTAIDAETDITYVPGIVNIATATNTAGGYSNFGDITDVYIIFRVNSITVGNTLFNFFAHASPASGLQITQTSTGLSFNGQTVDTVIGKWYILRAYIEQAGQLSGLSIYPLNAIATFNTIGVSGVVMPANVDSIGCAGGSAPADAGVAEVFLYNTSLGSIAGLANYFYGYYNETFALPLVFPAGAVSTTN